MRITLRRSGGFGGIRTTASLDIKTLTEKKAAAVGRLVDASGFFDLPKTVRGKAPQPDRFQFDLTIDDDHRSHTVAIAEEAASKPLKALLDWLVKNLKS